VSKTYTVGELVRELQRALIVDELQLESEVLNCEMGIATVTIVRGDDSFPGHVVFE
jgi:hypothetical protein